MDSIAFINITDEEAAILNQKPCCDVVIYLDVSDELLEKHCEKRSADFTDAKKIKESIEGDWYNHNHKTATLHYF